MPAIPTLTSHQPSTGEAFDAETLALLNELDVPLPNFANVDLDIAFGTPLEMYELATADELARHDAKRHILAADPSITALVRERLVDVLLPYADRLRRTVHSGCRPEYAAA